MAVQPFCASLANAKLLGLVNDNLDKTSAELITIISAERLRRQRQPHLVAHVRALEDQFGEIT